MRYSGTRDKSPGFFAFRSDMGAYEYAGLVERLLNSFEYFEARPARPTKIRIPRVSNPPFGWKEQFLLKQDKILTIQDFVKYDDQGNTTDRAFSYDFRECGSGDPIFRVCNHVKDSPPDAPCHVHVNTEANVINCFDTSVGKDFAYAMHCVKNFYLGKRQDWETEEADDPHGEDSAL